MRILTIILIAGVFALLQIFKIKDKFARIIHGLFVLSIGLSFINVAAVRLDSHYLFGVSCVVVIGYVAQNTEFSLQKKGILSAMAFIQMTSTVFILSQWPHVPIISMFGFITIAAFIFALAKDIKSYKNEIGFMAVLVADAIIKIIISLPAFTEN